ncbi:MAG: hypothetical protein JRN52_03785 [Nitrososphaerota archaeon]|nr:hypothetical protein [Nitrososphaerota archaeon]
MKVTVLPTKPPRDLIVVHNLRPSSACVASSLCKQLFWGTVRPSGNTEAYTKLRPETVGNADIVNPIKARAAPVDMWLMLTASA